MEGISHQAANIKTKFLILSDTHGMEFRPEDKPTQSVDVAIHCGDLTEESKLEEFQASIRLLRDINAPLKLVIAGNHDFTLDTPAFRKKIADAKPALDADLVRKVYGDYGEAREILEDARDVGIILLDEGNHQFDLENGARLTVYASPLTPSLGDWGFQYRPDQGHIFDVSNEVDIMITHGPPKGIMDYTDDKRRAGCPHLFEAVARARPRLHCFGHIHEGWGAKMVTWRHQPTPNPSHFTDINNDTSFTVAKLSSFSTSKFDTAELKEQKIQRSQHYRQQRCYATSHCTEDAHPLEFGVQTLFVNAAIQGVDDSAPQLPWLVDIELPRAT